MIPAIGSVQPPVPLPTVGGGGSGANGGPLVDERMNAMQELTCGRPPTSTAPPNWRASREGLRWCFAGPSPAAGVAGLDDRDAAFSWLERARAEHSQVLTFVKMDPMFDSLRSDSRYAELIRRIGLTP